MNQLFIGRRIALYEFPRIKNFSSFTKSYKVGLRNRYESTSASEFLSKECEKYQVGSKIGAYRINKVSPVSELNLLSILLTHEKTGAKHLHIARNDKNNTFGVAFRTTPMDSTGIPHILEHTALCGSRLFPVRDPFFKMLNRSLSTFMNAMTSSDWTLYLFSSQNSKDFRNLMSVYLDAAFYPLLRESDFRQEGWRLEHEKVDDKASPIVFKGVVFNEMKGVFSSQHSIFQEAVQNNLLPDHTYGVCSGGLPLVIPDLTWQALKDFHRKYYHPSNSRFYTYGDQPLESHLDLIEKTVLQHFNREDVKSDVPLQPRWTEPRQVKVTCRHNDMLPDASKQTTLAVSYLLTDVKDIYESSVLSLISHLLVSGENAPFYHSLIESNIGSGYAPVCGFEKSMRDTSFSVGLEGIATTDADKVVELIEETFQKVAVDGFPKEQIEALLSQVELSTKHQTAKFGLSLLLSLATPWNHDADPMASLHVNEIISRFRKNLAENPTFLQDYIKKYFVNNTHKLTTVMSPDETYEEKMQATEAAKLKTFVDSLSDSDKHEVFVKGKELAESQMVDQDLSCLPTLLITDIDKDIEKVKCEKILLDGVSVQLCEQPTNEVVYFQCLTDMSDLPSHLVPYVPLFCNLASKMGAGELDYKQQSQKIDRYTGGLGISHHLSQSPTDLHNIQRSVHMSSFCLKDNVSEMFSLWSDIFNSLKLDDLERISMLLKMSAADSVNSISMNGHRFAMCHSASRLSELNRLNEVLAGVTQVSFLKSLSEHENQQPVIGYLKDIASHILTKSSIKCAINAEGSSMNKVMTEMQTFLKRLPGAAESSPAYLTVDPYHNRPAACKTHFPMEFSVNYAGLSIPTVEYTHKDYPVIRVLARLLTNKYLHREIREKGGAYGGGATGDSPGSLSFYSYRDPNSLNTVNTMQSSINWLTSADIKQQHVDEAILAIFQKVDAPVSPGYKGLDLFLSEVTDDMKINHRNELKNVTVDKIKDVAAKYLREPACVGVTIIGPENDIIKADPSWTFRKNN